MTTKPPAPPFTYQSAVQKIRGAEDAWNGQDPEKVALAYTLNSWWRNRNTFLQGRDEIIEFLKAKWARELNYRLIKELWAFRTTELPCGIAMNPNPQRAGGIALMAMRIGNLKATA